MTGASRGIGKAIAQRLATDGAFVFVHFNHGQAEAEATLGAIRDRGGQGAAIQCDLSAPDGAHVLADRLLAALRRDFSGPHFDILVNNAGIGRGARLAETTTDEFDRVVTVNLRAPFFLIQRLLPHLRDGGRIINISSMGTRAPQPHMAAYAPAKAGLEVLTRLLANEVGGRSITVNAVAPGATVTDMNPRARDPVAARAIAAATALGRVGQPQDVAAVVAAIASPDGGWITGQTIDASGGQRL
ncbi:SDR family oxidoreductase [Phreatobacter sp.]|uniref:SDR family oxidoreductase n=1 Tax=Phreatobacter sp. TaxID=1966341 RepID=UPI0025DC5CB6|nr:SDR family oxidoreductase [Phreatobacter sp.]